MSNSNDSSDVAGAIAFLVGLGVIAVVGAGVIKVLQAIAEYEPEQIISTNEAASLASTYNYEPAPNCEIHGMDADLCENCGGCMECIGRDDAQFCVNCWYDDED